MKHHNTSNRHCLHRTRLLHGAIPALLLLTVVSSPAKPASSPDKPTGSAGLAICIGFGESATLDRLRWAETDAVAVGGALSRKGYRVICLTREEATLARVKAAISAKPTLVYFAGHCLDSKLQLKDGGLPIADIAVKTRVMLLDCCYAGGELSESGGTVVFAAGKGYAFEAGNNGLFTRHLLNWMKHNTRARKDGLVKYVSRRVARETGDWQRPVVGRL